MNYWTLKPITSTTVIHSEDKDRQIVNNNNNNLRYFRCNIIITPCLKELYHSSSDNNLKMYKTNNIAVFQVDCCLLLGFAPLNPAENTAQLNAQGLRCATLVITTVAHPQTPPFECRPMLNHTPTCHTQVQIIRYKLTIITPGTFSIPFQAWFVSRL